MLDLKEKFMKIIKSNSTNKAIDIISNIKNPINNEKLGINKAEQIYKLYVNEYMIEYDMYKYANNIDKYQSKVKNFKNKHK